MLIRQEGTEVAVIKYQVSRIVGVIEPTCVELGQLSQQFLRCLILVTFEWQETRCFVEMADNLSTWVVLEFESLPISIMSLFLHLVPRGVVEGKVKMVRVTTKGKRDSDEAYS